MKTRKCGVIAALTAVLLISAVLIIGCIAPLDGLLGSGREKKDADQAWEQALAQIPEGKALVRLNVTSGNANARTIMPDTSAYATLGDFDSFLLEYKLSSDPWTTLEDSITITDPDDFDVPIILVEADDYDFRLFALIAGTPDVVVASGQALAVDLSSGSGTVNIVLKEIVDGAGTGTFTWDVDLDGNGYSTAELTVYTYPDLVAVTGMEDIDLTADNTGTEDLDSGFYRVIIVLDQAKREPATVREILHIYQGMESEWTPTLPTLRRNVYDLVKEFHDGDVDPEDPTNLTPATTEDIAHAYLLEEDDATYLAADPIWQDPDGTKAFAGWYMDYDSTTMAYTVPLDDKLPLRVLDDLTLHAKWLDLGAIVIVGVVMPDDVSPVVSVVGSDYDRFTDTVTITISVTNTTVYGAAYEWDVDDGAPYTGGTGAEITIAVNADFIYQQSGVHIVEVTATGNGTGGTTAGRPYSTTVTFSTSN